MEKNGIGTDATMGSHIETIKDRKYVSEWIEHGGQPRMKAEKLGVALVNAYTSLNIAFSKPQIRQQMEKDSKAIERGTNKNDAGVVVIIIKIFFMSAFFFYRLLCNHTFQTNPKSLC